MADVAAPGLGRGGRVSRHTTSVHDAARAGLGVDIEKLRQGIADPESWAQEYECRFVDSATALLSFEMIQGCESAGASVQCTGRVNNALLGVDVGRRHDMTVLWLLEEMGDVLWTRQVKVMRGESFAAQRDAIYSVMDGHGIRRACIDATGIGAQLAEEAVRRYGARAEAVHFTQSVKEDLAIRTRVAFEGRSVRIPPEGEIRSDLHSLGREITPGGSTRFTAKRSSVGHADRFWALALAIHAAGSWRAGAQPVQYSSLAPRERTTGGSRADRTW